MERLWNFFIINLKRTLPHINTSAAAVSFPFRKERDVTEVNPVVGDLTYGHTSLTQLTESNDHVTNDDWREFVSVMDT